MVVVCGDPCGVELVSNDDGNDAFDGKNVELI
jgi:hypothetical protein